MLRTKPKIKLLLALGIMLLAVLVFSMNTVSANEGEVSSMGQMEIAAFNAKFESYAGENLSGANAKVLLNVVESHNASSEYKVKANKEISEITTSERYVVILKYDNEGRVNEVIIGQISYQEYIKGLKLTSPKYYEVDLDYLPYNSEDENAWDNIHQKFFKMIGDYYTKQINNKAITVQATSLAGGTEGGLNLWTFESGTQLSIYYNGNLCDTRNIGTELTVPVITVPNTITDNELNSYLKNVITKANKAFGEQITKIEQGTKSVTGVEIPNGYTIYSDYGLESVVIVRKEKVTEPVKIEETTTKIKLEADTTVIPSNTVLEVATITEGEVYNTVKTALTNISKFKVYDINLLSDGVKIQPNGKVKISVPVPTEYNKSNIVVYRVADNGDKTEYAVAINGDVATFETDHFSTYVLAEKEVKQNTGNTDNTETTPTKPVTEDRKKDDTPKTGTIASIYFIIPVTVISAIGIIAFRRKETK